MLNKEIKFKETEIPNSPEYNSGYYCGYKEGLSSIKNNKEYFSKDELKELGIPFSLSGEPVPITEKDLKRLVEYNKIQLIKKAVGWLKDNFVNGKEIGCDAGATHKNFKSIEEIIPSFIKKMEE